MNNAVQNQPFQETNTPSERYYRPLVDVIETPIELLLVADMPGVRREGLDIQFEDGELTVHGPVAERHVEGRTWLREYGVGDFYRTFRVSEQINAAAITADYAGGVLTVRLPKVEAVKPRKITVTGGKEAINAESK